MSPQSASAIERLNSRIAFLSRGVARLAREDHAEHRQRSLTARLAACIVLASEKSATALDIARASFPDDQVLLKAATAPAMTGVGGWAAELIAPLVLDVATSLLPASALTQLRALSPLDYEFDQGGIPRVPSHAPQASGGFVAEGASIPFAEMVITAATLNP